MPNKVDEQVQINGMPTANVNPEPRPFSQSVPEHVTGAQVVVERARVKVTRKSRSTYPKGNALALAYILKVPTEEALFAIFSRYVLIRDLVFTFDRQHEESWFEAYPQAVLLAPSEDRPTREELRAEYRKYATRLAHYSYYYDVAHKMRTGCLINLLTLSRFNGKTRQKDVASLARWAFINRNTGDMTAYPQPCGSVNSMIAAAKPATGSTANGVSVLALPLYDTSVYGNLGNHAGSLKDGIVDIQPDAGRDTDEAFGYADSQEMRRFYQHSAEIVSTYYRSKAFDILNASTLVVDGDSPDSPSSKRSAYFSLQRDGRKRFFDLDPTQETSLTRTVWDNYKFWAEMLATQFPEMRDPAHDITRLFKQLKFYEDCPTAEQVMNAVHSSAFYDITSLRNAMQYMFQGKANTATVVRQSLPIVAQATSVNDADRVVATRRHAIFEDTVFERNFERYKFFEDTAAEWIAQAKAWPGLTPRCFPDADSRAGAPESQAAVVAGAISSDGSIAAINEGFMNAGKYATYFDYATHQTLDPSKSIVEISAVGESTAAEIVNNREGFICAEDPSQLFVRQSDFIDRSDPFQCGFYLLSAVPDAAKSQLEEFLSDPASSLGPIQDPENTKVASPATAQVLSTQLDGVPISLSRDTRNGVPPRNTSYVFNTADWYSLLFVGDMPFLLPEARTLLNSLAMPFEASKAFNTGSELAKFTWMDAIRQKFRDLQGDAAIEAAILAQSELIVSKEVKKQATQAVLDVLPLASLPEEPDADNTIAYSAAAGKDGSGGMVDPRQAKFFLRRKDASSYANGKAVTHAQTDTYRLLLKSWTPGGDTGIAQCAGDLTWRDQSGRVLSLETVTFANTGYFTGPSLDYSQLLELQTIAGTSGSSASVTRSDTLWVNSYAENFTQEFENAKANGSFWVELDQVDSTGRVIPGGYTLGIQIPLVGVVEKMAKTSGVKKAISNIVSAFKGKTGEEMSTVPDDERVAEPAQTVVLSEASKIGSTSAMTSLWRLATNVVRDAAQKECFVVANKVGTTLRANPGAVIASIIASKFETTNAVRLYMFNPQYGPVAIIMPPIPQDADYGFIPDIRSDQDKVAKGGEVSEIVPKLGAFQLSGGQSYRYDQRNSFQDTQWSSHLWRWAVKAFAFQQAKLVNGRPIVQGGRPVRFDDEIAIRWPLTMYAQLVVTFAGSGDIDFFDNVSAHASEMRQIDASTTSPTTVNGLIFVPAKLLTKPLRAGIESSTGPDRTKETYAQKQQQAAYAPKAGGTPNPEVTPARPSHSSGGPRGKRRKGHSAPHGGQRFERKFERGENNESTVKGDDVTGVITTSSVEARDGGSIDMSSKRTDKQVESRFDKASKATPLIL